MDELVLMGSCLICFLVLIVPQKGLLRNLFVDYSVNIDNKIEELEEINTRAEKSLKGLNKKIELHKKESEELIKSKEEEFNLYLSKCEEKGKKISAKKIALLDLQIKNKEKIFTRQIRDLSIESIKNKVIEDFLKSEEKVNLDSKNIEKILNVISKTKNNNKMLSQETP